jgi:hypothetical protein
MMRKRTVSFVKCWMCVFVLCLGGVSYGMATEQIGPDTPDRPTVSQPGWAKGIVEIPRHPSRVYSIWVNGNENFYFKATPAEVNEIVTAFSKVHIRDHEVVITAEAKQVKSLQGGDSIDYNVNLQIVAGIALGMAREGGSDLPLEPRLTILVGKEPGLLQKVAWSKNLIVSSELKGPSIPSGRTRSQRDMYYAKCEFADGSPPEGFVRNVNSRITLWEQGADDGIEIGRIDYQGYMGILLSKEEMADLQGGKSWLTATIANFLTEARKTDQRIPVDRLVRDKGQTKAVQVKGPDYYYGRILFEDGKPPVLDPPPWPGAEIEVSFPFAGSAQLDSEGYFKVLLTEEQYEKAKTQKAGRNIYIPDYIVKNQASALFTFPAAELSHDKAKAGVVKIPRPVLPKKELIAAESKIGKAIPSFDSVRFEGFEPNQAKGKPLLLCFWDYDLRSSRQCVEAMQKQKDALEKKGLVVLVIHAGSQPPEQVKEWLGKTGVTLPSGTVQGDSHDALLTWGAKGMPWLILTNARHMVVKEGFTLDQFLESK